MNQAGPSLTRRRMLAVLGATAAAGVARTVEADPGLEPGPGLALVGRTGSIALRTGPETQFWTIAGAGTDDVLKANEGDQLRVRLSTEWPVPAVINWHGLDGAPAAEPLLARPVLTRTDRDAFTVPLRRAGTSLLHGRMLGDGLGQPIGAKALVVRERDKVAVDRDAVVQIDDWRLRADGTALAPGLNPADTDTVYTVNGLPRFTLTARRNERLRLRFINCCQRNVIAVEIAREDVRVMAIDGLPAEPFFANRGRLVMAPGNRIDVFLDVKGEPGSTVALALHDGSKPTVIGAIAVSADPPIRPAPLPPANPLPAPDLPAELDLKGALRADLPLNAGSWIAPAKFALPVTPAFTAKKGRTVVLTVSNSDTAPRVFHLHGHHFRLLDRLDDGWKPFWLDTLAVGAGQTQRIAFLAEFVGSYLLEAMGAEWAAPRLILSYAVEG